MHPGKIRVITLCAVIDKDRLLVYRGQDSLRNITFYRLLGGGIEFGERGCDAVAREFREELGAELLNPEYLGTIENIFTYNGLDGHEIVLLFKANLADSSLYDFNTLPMNENGEQMLAYWMPLSGFRDGSQVLYPDGVLNFLGLT